MAKVLTNPLLQRVQRHADMAVLFRSAESGHTPVIGGMPVVQATWPSAVPPANATVEAAILAAESSSTIRQPTSPTTAVPTPTVFRQATPNVSISAPVVGQPAVVAPSPAPVLPHSSTVAPTAAPTPKPAISETAVPAATVSRQAMTTPPSPPIVEPPPPIAPTSTPLVSQPQTPPPTAVPTPAVLRQETAPLPSASPASIAQPGSAVSPNVDPQLTVPSTTPPEKPVIEDEATWGRLQTIFNRHQERIAQEEAEKPAVGQNPPPVQTTRSSTPIVGQPTPSKPLPVAPPPSRPAPPGFRTAVPSGSSTAAIPAGDQPVMRQETAVPSPPPPAVDQPVTAMGQPAATQPVTPSVESTTESLQRQADVASIPSPGTSNEPEMTEITSVHPSPGEEMDIDQPNQEQRLPLEAVWPVQRQVSPPAPISTPPLVQRAPGEPIPDLPSEEVEVVRQTLSRVSAGQPTDSSVELVLPRRPRPGTQPPAPKLASPTADVQRQPEAPATPAPSVEPDVAPATAVPTDIGPLPADLWRLVGHQPPVTATPAQPTPPVMRAIETAELPALVPPTEEVEKTESPSAQTVIQAVEAAEQPPTPPVMRKAETAENPVLTPSVTAGMEATQTPSPVQPVMRKLETAEKPVLSSGTKELAETATPATEGVKTIQTPSPVQPIMRQVETAEVSPSVPTMMEAIEAAEKPSASATTIAQTPATEQPAASPLMRQVETAETPVPVSPAIARADTIQIPSLAQPVMRKVETAEAPPSAQTVMQAIEAAEAPPPAPSSEQEAEMAGRSVSAQSVAGSMGMAETPTPPVMRKTQTAESPAFVQPQTGKIGTAATIPETTPVMQAIETAERPTPVWPMTGRMETTQVSSSAQPVMRQEKTADSPGSSWKQPKEQNETEDADEISTAEWPAPFSTWMTPPDIQREETSATAVSTPPTPSTGGETEGGKTAELDMDDLARRVYSDIKRRLVVEWERVRGRF